MRVEDFVTRADQLIAQFDEVLTHKYTEGYATLYVDAGNLRGVRSAAMSFLRATFGPTHPFYTEVERSARNDLDTARGLRQILVAAREEMVGGWSVSVRGLIAADIFADFLEMAGYLLAERYKDASAVMIGSVLEEHLRQLCVCHGMGTEFVNGKGESVPKKADQMNTDLSKAGVYGRLDQKNVTAWLDLRNKAAHGRYTEYTQPQVELMHQAVSDFMARIPTS